MLSSLGGGGDVSSYIDQPTVIREQNTYYRVKFNETVELPCVIEHRRQASVIWQYSKLRIPETLSIGYLYIRQDYRIRVVVNASDEREQSWNLRIRKVRLEDEGFYLCKVTAEHETLKRAIYLKVDVDLSIKQESGRFMTGEDVTLICNTSYPLPTTISTISDSNNDTQQQQISSKARSSGKHSRTSSGHHQSHPRLVWYKDGQRLYHIQPAPSQSVVAMGENNNANLTINEELLDYKIEYHAKPVLWSRLYLRALKPTDMGVYTCAFRNQNVSIDYGLNSG